MHMQRCHEACTVQAICMWQKASVASLNCQGCTCSYSTIQWLSRKMPKLQSVPCWVCANIQACDSSHIPSRLIAFITWLCLLRAATSYTNSWVSMYLHLSETSGWKAPKFLRSLFSVFVVLSEKWNKTLRYSAQEKTSLWEKERNFWAFIDHCTSSCCYCSAAERLLMSLFLWSWE